MKYQTLINWLFQKTNPFSQINNKKVLDHLFQYIYNFINSCDDLSPLLTKDLMLTNFLHIHVSG